MTTPRLRVLGLVILVGSAIACSTGGRYQLCSCPRDAREALPILCDWLKEPVTVEQVENHQIDKRFSIDPDDDRWIALRNEIQPDDEIWLYDGIYPCPNEHRNCITCGGAGIVLVRGCSIAYSIRLLLY